MSKWTLRSSQAGFLRNASESAELFYRAITALSEHPVVEATQYGALLGGKTPAATFWFTPPVKCLASVRQRWTRQLRRSAYSCLFADP